MEAFTGLIASGVTKLILITVVMIGGLVWFFISRQRAIDKNIERLNNELKEALDAGDRDRVYIIQRELRKYQKG